MSKAPLPSFLLLPGDPDPQAPTPRAHETLRGSGSQGDCNLQQESKTPDMQGRNDVLSPENTGAEKFDLPEFLNVPPAPAPPKVPKPKNMGNQNLAPPPVLDIANMLGFTMPQVEDDPDYSAQDPEIRTFIRVLATTGRVKVAADRAGLHRSRLYKLRDRDKKFRALWKKALEGRSDLIEDEAMRRAVQGVEEPVYYMGSICGYKRVYSDALLGKLMEGNIPEKYRANHKVEVTGAVGVATLVLPAVTTADEWLAQNNGTIIDQLPESDYD